MPSSYIENAPHVVSFMHRIDPESMLDVGTGYGKYGFLFRERIDDFRWARTLDGVEVFDDYLARSRAAYLYDEVYRCNFLDFSPEKHYDLLLMIDVLEHFTEDEGKLALEKAVGMADHVLVCTPIGYAQGEVNGNVHEAHRSEWPAYAMRSFAKRHADLRDVEVLRTGTQDTRLYHLSLDPVTAV